MTDDVEVRHGRVDDVDALIEFWSIAGENDSRPSDTGEAVLRLLSRDADALLLAHSGPHIVGTVIAGWDGWRAHLYRLAVLPQRRREGIGRRLLAEAEARLVELGAPRLDAMVLITNESAHPAWSAAGYVPQENWARWVKPTR